MMEIFGLVEIERRKKDGYEPTSWPLQRPTSTETKVKVYQLYAMKEPTPTNTPQRENRALYIYPTETK